MGSGPSDPPTDSGIDHCVGALRFGHSELRKATKCSGIILWRRAVPVRSIERYRVEELALTLFVSGLINAACYPTPAQSPQQTQLERCIAIFSVPGLVKPDDPARADLFSFCMVLTAAMSYDPKDCTNVHEWTIYAYHRMPKWLRKRKGRQGQCMFGEGEG